MQLFENISRKSTEKDIEQKIIVPLLKAWGYQESDWQRQVPLGTKRADCIIYSVHFSHDKTPYCVIEIKAPRHRSIHKSGNCMTTYAVAKPYLDC
jgi:hypothetical protein